MPRSSAPAGRRRRRSPPSGRCRRWAGCWRSPAPCGWRRRSRRAPIAWPARRAMAIRWMMALVEQPIAIAHGDGVLEGRRASGSAPASGPPRPSPRCAGRSRRSCGCGWRRRRESTRRRAASGRSTSAMRRHGGRGAHGHAGAVAARDAGFHLDPVLVGDAPGAALVPVLAGVASPSRAPCPSSCRAASARRADRSQGRPSADGAHQQARRGLVAAAHQHRRRRPGGCAAVPRSPSPGSCGRAWWSA